MSDRRMFKLHIDVIGTEVSCLPSQQEEWILSLYLVMMASDAICITKPWYEHSWRPVAAGRSASFSHRSSTSVCWTTVVKMHGSIFCTNNTESNLSYLNAALTYWMIQSVSVAGGYFHPSFTVRTSAGMREAVLLLMYLSWAVRRQEN